MLPITRRELLGFAGLGTASFLSGCQRSWNSDARPNIVMIIIDDLGYADLGLANSPDLVTPNIDSIAKNGIRCTDAYMGASVCSPSRACIMTGRFPCRFGYMYNPFSAPETYGLPTTETTIAEVMRAGGYTTGLIGKWHLGNRPEYLPTNRGFDEFYGSPDGLTDYIAPDPESNRMRDGLKLYRGTTPVADLTYVTDAIGRESCDFVKRNSRNPFFLVLSHTAPHTPLEVPQRYLDRIQGVKDPARRLYAAVLCAVDDAVGRLIAQLKESGVYENTLLMFFSDNGGSLEELPVDNHPLRGGKGTLRDGGLRVPFLVQWPSCLPKDTFYSNPMCATDILPTCAAAAGFQPVTQQPLDGINLLPLLRGEAEADPARCLYWAQGSEAAIRRGDWKFVKRSIPGRTELYYLPDDPGEDHNLAGKQLEIARELGDLLDKWIATLPEPLWEWAAKPPKTAPIVNPPHES